MQALRVIAVSTLLLNGRSKQLGKHDQDDAKLLLAGLKAGEGRVAAYGMD